MSTVPTAMVASGTPATPTWEGRRPRVLDLVAEALAEQQRLQTPVVRFADHHDWAYGSTPTMATVYRDLIPLSAPGPGEQYAFEVDLDSCTGCKSCVSGCHSLNGLDDDETWRDVGVLLGGDTTQPFQQTVTTACHHCADPACLAGCPVLAYEKDPVTGIVRHLDDQCIGCSYCILKCPYDVPKFSERLGIVRKCDMCHGRLAEGEAPACVQACPTHAISIVTVPLDRSGARPTADTSLFLPASPDPAYSQPTTRYVSVRALPNDLVAADASEPRPEHAHWPLAVLTTFTQAALGLVIAWTGGSVGPTGRHVAGWLVWPAVVLAVLGVTASVLHLGRPERAWRVFLGLRTSWLSREAVAFGAWLPVLIVSAWRPGFVPFVDVLPVLCVVVGSAAVGCSAMIYIDTPRRFWRPLATGVRMGGTVAVATLIPLAPVVAVLALTAKVGFEVHQQRSAASWGVLLRTVLRPVFVVRCSLAAVAGIGLVIGGVADSSAGKWATGTVMVVFGAAVWLAAEVIERLLYFRAVDRSKMPGIASS